MLRGGLVMAGYYKNPQATAEASTFGWHHTGDIGVIDEDGFVYIVDRKKDMIISGGFNVFPSEVEQVLWSHPAVQDCAVIGVPDEKWGEAVKAVVELKPGAAGQRRRADPSRQGQARRREGAQVGRLHRRACRAARSARC